MNESSSTKKYDVFLSHHGTDKEEVEIIATLLKARGIIPFLDKWHLIPGEPWQEALELALDGSSTCAVFIGPSGLGPWGTWLRPVQLLHRQQGSTGVASSLCCFRERPSVSGRP